MKRNVLEYLEDSAKKYPDKFAFSDTKNQVTYRDLLLQAKAVGSCLASAFREQTNQPVAVIIDRNITSLISFMGVVFSGNFYVPIDGKLPHHRIEVMLDTLQPQAILSQRKDIDLLQSLNTGINTILFEEAVSNPIDDDRLARIRAGSTDEDPLCIYFTSGSTGIPKGAILNHRSVIDMTELFSEIFGFSDDCIFGSQAAFDFSVSLKDIYSSLRNGASLQIIPTELFAFPSKVIQYLNETGINTAIWVTSALRIMANLKGLDKEVPIHLKKILFSGEVMPNKVLNYWRKRLPQAQYINLYGQSEIAYNCAYYVVDRAFEDNELLPAGVPFPNNEVFVLDEKGHPVGNDELGEIYIKGSCLAMGYFNNPVETAKAFCQNPVNPHYPEIVYKTGDLGKFNERGELLFISRKDHQIKHMGHRIELGEIEVAANALNFIEAACCMYDADREKIVLFYQAALKCDREIIVAMQDYLPKYMLPNKLVHYEQLPLNKNAKIDRTQLKEQYFNGTGH